jgi:hypothetical protein
VTRMLSPTHVQKRKVRRPHALKQALDVSSREAIKTGDVVGVFGFRPGVGMYFEGLARVDSICSAANTFRVRFHSERMLKTRFVHPEWKTDAESSFALLNEFWRTNMLPEFDDFFPEENN